MVIRFDSVTKTFQVSSATVHALVDVSFAIEAGEFVAVVGPSGCGKSTLLHISGGLLRPDSGTVTIDEHDLYSLTRDRRAQLRSQCMGFVFQQFHLIPYLSVADNILAPSIASPERDAAERARSLAEQFGLADRLGHIPAELSAGQQQRTALARAMLNRPGIVLADEPTGNLDRDNTNMVLGHLRQVANDGCAVLLVTHDSAAADQADRLLRIRNGRLDADDSPSQARDAG